VSTSCDVLLLAAFPPELAALRPALGEAMRAPIGRLDVIARTLGVGIAASAAATASRLEAMRPRGVVLLGTCGAYPIASNGASLEVGDVAIARKIRLVEPAVLEGRAAFPEPMSVEAQAEGTMLAGLSSAGAGGRAVDVATVLGVTTDDAMAEALARGARCDVEHLEAFAVAAACAAAGVPFAAALGVANVVGSQGREQWRKNHRAASDAAVALTLAWLRAGGLGLPLS
jgi:futalosine hydrolase